MKEQHNFIIKYVYEDWFEREDKDYEVGFNKKYKDVHFPVGGKMLIYVVGYKIIVGAYYVTGTFFRNMSESQHPLRLPIKKIYRIEEDRPAISSNQIRKVVPGFKPNELVSYWDITEDQYNKLENMLINA
ncbi:hypothetical protein [Mesobacillus jeotgali]|uniref:hypothetical protein n=1 Tax=Mesobacillus jeotgali TaxID=129985 RepID=UPI000C838E96|nr:hypothetical protein [Mesobacillus jeotgali]